MYSCIQMYSLNNLLNRNTLGWDRLSRKRKEDCSRARQWLEVINREKSPSGSWVIVTPHMSPAVLQANSMCQVRKFRLTMCLFYFQSFILTCMMKGMSMQTYFQVIYVQAPPPSELILFIFSGFLPSPSPSCLPFTPPVFSPAPPPSPRSLLETVCCFGCDVKTLKCVCYSVKRFT